jgi:hypothetical protein
MKDSVHVLKMKIFEGFYSLVSSVMSLMCIVILLSYFRYFETAAVDGVEVTYLFIYTVKP